ncbi:hypothetical protein [Thiohalophilus sp.]|uniref:hypothetical protein n=1 Tax=Thiohalophilus sp. TaxID=3028392 RepID=UPI002ACD30C9|nr:hypothetical protein [Thiohalophilus sp.]MDZ7663672.1 hypothetical protein [Thiohalophilus sp.]
MNKLQLLKQGLLISLVIGLAACGGKTQVESDLGIRGGPEWVNEGTQYLNDRDGRLFHGVGHTPPMGDKSLQIATADNRARAEVARILSSYMDVVSDDYSAHAASAGRSINQQNVSRQINNLTRVNLTGVRIIGHWQNEQTGNIWSIAELDMARIAETLDKVDDMNADLKRYISDQGGNIFDSLAQEN